MSEEKSTLRAAGLYMLGLGCLIVFLNYILSITIGVFFWLLILPSGPLISFGVLMQIFPRCTDAFDVKKRKRMGILEKISTYIALLSGVSITALALAFIYGGL